MRKQALIIGAGLAGMAAAQHFADGGWQVRLVSNGPSHWAQSVMAEGGINAALNDNADGDSWELHAQETLESACGLADEAAVRGMAKAAPELIRSLDDGVVIFNKKNGHVAQRAFGGQSCKRTVYSRSETGKQLVNGVMVRLERHEQAGLVERFSRHEFVTLLMDGQRCCGAVVRDVLTSQQTALQADVVVMACGGFGGLFPQVTGSSLNTGLAHAELFRLGVEYANLEFIQYHPTALVSGSKAFLVSEAARGEGARLFVETHGTRNYFMEERYAQGNLETRDVTARACWRAGQTGQVYLDMTCVPKDALEGKLTGLVDTIRHYGGIDSAKEPVPVQPAIHFFMGGIRVDAQHRTSMPGLYAAGECDAQYHGANRLGGNSLLAAIYGGDVAAQAAIADAAGADNVAAQPADCSSVPAAAKLNEMAALQAALDEALGIVRTEANMKKALGALEALEQTPAVLLGKGMLKSALARKESRGAHFREDYPEANEAFAATTVAKCDAAAERIDISFEPVQGLDFAERWS